MSRLQQIAQADPRWSLEDFVDVANEILPQFLPDQEADKRVQETVNPRLVRHYTTLGLLDKPLKQGREARYCYRHLLQLLVLRRLLADGYSASSVGNLVAGMTDASLEELLQGGAQLTVETANPALAFLTQVRQRTQAPNPETDNVPQSAAGPPLAPPPGAAVPSPRVASAPSAAPAAQWTRLEILDGLELHIRSDFVFPATAHEREQLMQLIAHHLAHLTQARRFPP